MEKEWFFKSFYLLAILDYLSDRYEMPYFEAYNNIRKYKLSEPIFPLGIVMLDNINQCQKQRAIEECGKSPVGKYFIKYNIVEKDIEDVV